MFPPNKILDRRNRQGINNLFLEHLHQPKSNSLGSFLFKGHHPSHDDYGRIDDIE
jgi:hypothetical protein